MIQRRRWVNGSTPASRQIVATGATNQTPASKAEHTEDQRVRGHRLHGIPS